MIDMIDMIEMTLIGLLALQAVLVVLWLYCKFAVAVADWWDRRTAVRHMRARALSSTAQRYLDELQTGCDSTLSYGKSHLAVTANSDE